MATLLIGPRIAPISPQAMASIGGAIRSPAVRRLEFAGRVLLRLRQRIGRRSDGRSKAASARGITVCSSSRIPVKNYQGALLVSMQLHQSAYEQAQKLIRNFQFVLDQTSDWTDHRPPRHGQRKFIEEHGLAEFGKWHLGRMMNKPKITKAGTSFRTAISRMFIVARYSRPNHAPASTNIQISRWPPVIRVSCWMRCWLRSGP